MTNLFKQLIAAMFVKHPLEKQVWLQIMPTTIKLYLGPNYVRWFPVCYVSHKTSFVTKVVIPQASGQ